MIKRLPTIDHPVRSLDEIYELAVERTKKYGPYRVAVAAVETIMSLGGLKLGREHELIEPILIGDQKKIFQSMEKLEISPKGWQIIAEKDHHRATKKAAGMVSSGLADILMRGKLLARDFFHVLLAPEMELRRKGDMWNNIAVLDIEGIDRLLFLSDCALVSDTDLPGRLKLIQNAFEFAMFLGVKEPKVALLAAVEAVTPGMPVSLEEAVIAKMSERGQFPPGIEIDGPLSLDLSLIMESVKKKKIKSPVAGRADVLVVNNLSIGNILFKSMITLCGARSASVIVGAPIPIILTSRSESPENSLFSFALTILMSGPKD
ncbi:MAG: phosphate acyltransferase [Candidatus Electryoneaceae bacterium]|nr:phosphate acyltransferase [Candidatus Electryoneaceae bacterium]